MSKRGRSTFMWGSDGIVHVLKPNTTGRTLYDEEERPCLEAICGALIMFPPIGVSTERLPTCDACLALTGITPSMFDQEAS